MTGPIQKVSETMHVPRGGSRLARFIRLSVCGLIAFVWAAEAWAQQRIGAGATSNRWEVLEGCRLIEAGFRDGDNFHTRHRDREYVFRLYFVDAPETDETVPERIEDQAAYFGISPQAVREVGLEASRFTGVQLKEGFTVVTRWQNAQGKGSLARFYAVVLVDGKNLSAELVRNGLARIHGSKANWPDGPRSSKFSNELKNLEITAREQRRGAWDDQRYPRTTAAKGAGKTKSQTGAAKPAVIDLNDASIGELVALPGIGKKLAERIIAHRPYQSVDDLKRINGIGEKTLDRLRPLVTVHPPGEVK